jgi:hypothetical protein
VKGAAKFYFLACLPSTKKSWSKVLHEGPEINISVFFIETKMVKVEAFLILKIPGSGFFWKKFR